MNTAIAEAGIAALRRGDARTARTAFETLEQTGQGSHQLRLLLAQCCTMLGDAPAAHRALDKVLAEEPGNLYALIMRGDLLTQAGDERAAVSWYQTALAQAPHAGQLPPDLIESLRRVQAAVRRTRDAFHAHLEEQLDASGVASQSVGQRFSEALDLLTGRAEIQLQRPTSFYYPQLPQRTFFEREEFPWIAALEAAAPAVRAELMAILADDEALVPYVAADPDRPAKRHALMGDPRWSAFHLYRFGEPVPENTGRCPTTTTVLGYAPIPRIAGRSPMALFSVLRPGTHIPPHNGMLNTRLICHLPLIVPPGCRLRVGNQTREVVQDRMMIFDDSIEHEAWNESAETRVVLLFEIWRPELDESERAALTTLFGAIGDYVTMAEDQAGA